MSEQLADQAARDHIRTRLDESVFVEAGAGTGKTSEMVRRIVALVASERARIEQIVAITFTEAAAGELRERVRHALEVEAAGGPAAVACENALKSLDEAPIQTIHGFARRLLVKHPTESGLPPVFEVNDQVTGRLAFDRRWRRFLADTLASEAPLAPEVDMLLRCALALGVETRHLRGLAEKFEQNWHRLDRSNGLPPAPTRLDVAPIATALHAIDAERRECCKDTSHELSARIDEWLEWAEALDASPSVLAVAGRLANPPTATLPRSWKGAWETPDYKRVGAAFKELPAIVDGVLAEMRSYVVAGLTSIITDFVVAGADARRAAGTLDFHDLLVHARRLLISNEPVRRQLQETYRYLLVDEFQDTDPLQAEIVAALTEGRSLFVVGDPKQSIYRFRNADPVQYARTRTAMADRRVGLTTNFRTLPAVVEWVNQAFEAMITKDDPESWQALSAGRSSEISAGVRLVGQRFDRKDKRAGQLRSLEAQELVDAMVEAKSNRWTVGQRDVDRPVRYGDMAVLMPTRTSLPALERELRRQEIPYRIESRSLIWSTQELRDLVSFVRSIADPTDEVATVAALRSAALACTDRQLLDWKAAGGSWDYRKARQTPSGSPEVLSALNRLRELHDERHWLNVPALVDELIVRFQLFELAHTLPRQRETWSRLRYFVDRCRQWFEDGGAGLHDFVEWCRLQSDEAVDALESVVPDSDDDAVRVMTIHASKGLEFPVVFLTGLGSKPRRIETASVLWGEDGACHMQIGRKDLGLRTDGHEDVAELEKRYEEAEQRRLLYVGATRARDHLVIGVNHTDTQSLAAQLCDACTDIDPIDMVLRPWPDDEASDGAVRPVEAEVDRASVVAAAAVPASLSATAIRNKINGDQRHLPRSMAPTGDDELDDLAERLAFGSAVHHALELLQRNRAATVEEVVATAAAAEELERRQALVERSVRLAVDSPLWNESMATTRTWPEVTVSALLGGTVVGGTIDLLFEREDGLVVVDYKTDVAFDEADAAALAANYKWQLLTYAYALEQSLGRRVTEASLLLVGHSMTEAVRVSVGDVAEGVADLRSRFIEGLLVSP